MNTIDSSIPCDDQPINGATLVGENRFLSSFITPGSLEIQEKYKALTEDTSDQRDRIVSVWRYVKDIPYTQSVNAKVNIGGRVFSRYDVWLDPAQALKAGVKLNCMNKSTLLVSLLRQELSADKVSVCLNNVTIDGIGGHAVGYVRLEDGDYIFETTNPSIKSPFLRAEDADIYEAVMFVNDKETRYIPSTQLREPLGCCCVSWLEEYINEKLCTSYV